jgi:hypothetical protein
MSLEAAFSASQRYQNVGFQLFIGENGKRLILFDTKDMLQQAIDLIFLFLLL